MPSSYNVQLLFILLTFLAGASRSAETCNALFVLDGSDANPNFRVQLLSLAQAADLLFSATAIPFAANSWTYGDASKQSPIPQFFYNASDDFVPQLQQAQRVGGSQNIADVAPILNSQAPSTVIVLVTASTQRTVNKAGDLYHRKSDTVGISINTGIDLSAIGQTQYLSISDPVKTIADAVTEACNKFVPIYPDTTVLPTTQKPTTILTETSTPSMTTTKTVGPPCQALFAIDVSDIASLEFFLEMSDIRAVAANLYQSSVVSFRANAWGFGDEKNDNIPTTFLSDMDSLEAILENISDLEGDEQIDGAVVKLNNWPISNAVIILYSASSQRVINGAGKKYSRQNATVGMSLDYNDISPVAVVALVPSAQIETIAQSIENICLNLRVE